MMQFNIYSCECERIIDLGLKMHTQYIKKKIWRKNAKKDSQDVFKAATDELISAMFSVWFSSIPFLWLDDELYNSVYFVHNSYVTKWFP